MNRAHGVGVGNDVKIAWAVHTQVLFAHVRPLVSYGVTCSETLPMRKLPTGEPYARKPHVRLCVQVRLACSAGDSPAGVEVRAP